MKIVEESLVDYIVSLKLISAEYVEGYKILITFNDGQKTVIDFKPFLSKSQHPSIRKYLDLERFRQFKIVNGNLNWHDYDLIFPLSDLKKGQIS